MAETLGSLCDKLTKVKLKRWHSDDAERLLERAATSFLAESLLENGYEVHGILCVVEWYGEMQWLISPHFPANRVAG